MTYENSYQILRHLGGDAGNRRRIARSLERACQPVGSANQPATPRVQTGTDTGARTSICSACACTRRARARARARSGTG